MDSTTLTVLDKGFVRLVDRMGTDLTVVNAARVSFSKKSEWAHDVNDKGVPCNPHLSERDAKLIKYLARHNHWTPFGHPQLTFHMKMPLFVARQWMRSNVGIVYNEVSRRYVDDAPEFYEPKKWRPRPDRSMKQGSGEGEVKVTFGETNPELLVRPYNDLLDQGVAPEMARMVLPQSMYTEFWMTASLAACARMFGLRVDSHAQYEVQCYAQSMGKLIEPLFPVSWAALVDNPTATETP